MTKNLGSDSEKKLTSWLRVSVSTYLLFLIILASPAVSQELGKDEAQLEARLQVLAYDTDIIAERFLEGM